MAPSARPISSEWASVPLWYEKTPSERRCSRYLRCFSSKSSTGSPSANGRPSGRPP